MDADEILNTCKDCMASCCKLGGADLTEAEMKNILDAGHADNFMKVDKNHYEMKSIDGVCPYLHEENYCTIHQVRPTMCRCWPVDVQFEARGKKFYINSCPLTKFYPEEEIKKSKEILKTVPDHFLTHGIEESNLSEKDKNTIVRRYSKFKAKPID